ncbi:MAG: acetolactate synthase [Bacteroidetes bacterium]|nr:acetolactate synthase [Bacteroidota bacterium]MBK9636047.1 acetolactate synthase [Bacteroidota bacterium]
MKPYKIVFISHNQPVLIGRYMLIFSRRRVDVTNFSFKKLNETEGEFTIEFNAEEWAAENLLKQVQKQIDIFEAKLILNGL